MLEDVEESIRGYVDEHHELTKRIYYSNTIVILPDGRITAINDILTFKRFQEYCIFLRKVTAEQITPKTLSEHFLRNKLHTANAVNSIIQEFIGNLIDYNKSILEANYGSQQNEIENKYKQLVKNILLQILGFTESDKAFHKYHAAFLNGQPNYEVLHNLLKNELLILYQQRLEERMKNITQSVKEVTKLAKKLPSVSKIQSLIRPELSRFQQNTFIKPLVSACLADPKLKIFMLSNLDSVQQFGWGFGGEQMIKVLMGEYTFPGTSDLYAHAIAVYADELTCSIPMPNTLLDTYLIDLSAEITKLPQLAKYSVAARIGINTIAALAEELSDYATSRLASSSSFQEAYQEKLKNFKQLLDDFDTKDARIDIAVAMHVLQNQGKLDELSTANKKLWQLIVKITKNVIRKNQPKPLKIITLIQNEHVKVGDITIKTDSFGYQSTYTIKEIITTIQDAGNVYPVVFMEEPAMPANPNKWSNAAIADFYLNLLNAYGDEYAKVKYYPKESYVPEMIGKLCRLMLTQFPGLLTVNIGDHWTAKMAQFYKDYYLLSNKAAIYPQPSATKICVNDICVNANMQILPIQSSLLNQPSEFMVNIFNNQTNNIDLDIDTASNQLVKYLPLNDNKSEQLPAKKYISNNKYVLTRSSFFTNNGRKQNPYYNGYFSNDISQHPRTNAPIFTFYVNDANNAIVGSMQFYGTPILCRTETGHNIINATGILKDIVAQIDSNNIHDICAIQPLTYMQELYYSATDAAMSGGMHGGCYVVQEALTKLGYSSSLAYLIANLSFYTMIFFTSLYEESQKTNNINEAIYQAGIYTAKAGAINISLHKLAKLSVWFYQRGHTTAGAILGFISKYGMLAYATMSDSMAEFSLSFGTAVSTSYITETVGKKLLGGLEKVSNNLIAYLLPSPDPNYDDNLNMAADKNSMLLR